MKRVKEKNCKRKDGEYDDGAMNEKAKLAHKKWREANPEKWKEAQKKVRDKRRGGPARVKLTEEEKAERRREAQKKWREKHPEQVKKNSKKWREKHPEKQAEAMKKWSDENPAMVKAASARYRRKKMIERLQSVEGLSGEIYKLAWLKDSSSTLPRGVALWVGEAMERADLAELVRVLVSDGLVLVAKREKLEVHRADGYGRTSRAIRSVHVGWFGWVTNLRKFEKLPESFGLDAWDFSGIDDSMPDYFACVVFRNLLGNDLTKIRVGDRWKGWKLDQRKLHEACLANGWTIRSYVLIDGDDGSVVVELRAGDSVVDSVSVPITHGTMIEASAWVEILEWARGIYDTMDVVID
jgi:hypothetical protein